MTSEGELYLRTTSRPKTICARTTPSSYMSRDRSYVKGAASASGHVLQVRNLSQLEFLVGERTVRTSFQASLPRLAAQPMVRPCSGR